MMTENGRRRFTVKCLAWWMAVLLSLNGSYSCIREDRVECPATLVVDLKHLLARIGTADEMDGQVQVLLFRGECLEISRRFGYGCRPDTCQIQTARGDMTVTVLLLPVLMEAVCTGDRLFIREGAQADSLFACSLPVCLNQEVVEVHPELHKEFATVYLEIMNSEKYPEMSMEVTGERCGLYLPGLSPVPGHFRYRQGAASGERIRIFRLYRQNAPDLLMNLTSSAEGPEIRDIPLGRIISETGYDFQAEELKDIHLTLNIAEGEITAIIEGWEDEYVSRIY